MNRDIEFRGKTVILEWQYGFYTMIGNKHYICTPKGKNGVVQYCIDDENTIGQYTGLKDKNGKKIFEGDIIRLDDDYRKSISSCDAKTEEELVRKDCLVGFKDGSFMFCRNRYVIDDFDSYLWISNKYCEVIGNIYENKELLEG